MATQHDRGARREREAAKALGVRRVKRARYQTAPDIEPVRLPTGQTLIVEVKTRQALPRVLRLAVEQARSYLPDAVPCAVLSETGGRAMVCLPLDAFAGIAGIGLRLARVGCAAGPCPARAPGHRRALAGAVGAVRCPTTRCEANPPTTSAACPRGVTKGHESRRASAAKDGR